MEETNQHKQSNVVGKKIISYEEFMGGKEMKRFDIRKDYDDGKIIITRKKHKDDYAIVRMLNYSYDVAFKIGNNYNFTLDQANSILKIMGLNYELYEEVKVDWSKVEDGTEIKIVDNGNIVKFMKYIPDLKTVIVREGDCFYTIDASEVELC